MSKISAIIAAAGKGERLRPEQSEGSGEEIPKPYLKLKGIPIIALTLKKFDELREIDSIIVVTHPRWLDYCKSEIIEKFGFKKVKYIIEGGERRQDSVRVGLEKITGNFVLIHDAVRPFITQEFITHLIEMAKKYKAVVPGMPVTDTIKKIENSFVCRTMERDRLWEIQTPQVFSLDIIKRAHTEAYKVQFYATDDSALVERLGIQVKVADGLPQNIKITTRTDLLYAERCLI